MPCVFVCVCICIYIYIWASQVALVVKNLPANARDIGDMDLIPGPGRSPGGGHTNPLQYSCLENPMDRGAWGIHSIVLQRAEHDWSTLARMYVYVCMCVYIYIIKQNLKVWCNNPVCEIAPSAQSWYQMKCSLLPEDGGVAGGFTVSFPPRCLVFMLCIPSYVSSKVVSPGYCQTFVWSFPLWSREVNSDKRRRLPWNTCKSYFKPSVLSNLKPFPLFFSLPKSSFLFRWEDKRTCTRSLSRPSTKGPGLVPSTPSLGLWDGFSAASASADAAILSLGASLIFAFYWIVLINVQDAVIASRQEILLRSSGFLPISVLTSKLLKSSF